MARFVVGVLVPLVLLATSTTLADSPAIVLEPCGPEGAENELECGVLIVPENPEEREGRTIPLRIVVAPALEPGEGAPARFELAGGPGIAATEGSEFFVGPGRRLRQSHTVVLVDQRGTGGSAPLRCPQLERRSPLEEMYPVAEVESCRDELGKTADLTRYTTANSVADLDAVRQALGHQTIDLFAISYGTELARAYMASHPDHVRRVLLIGAPGTDLRTPLTHAAHAQRALDLLFHECQDDDACRRAFPDLRADWRRALARVDEGVQVRVGDPAREITIHPGAFREALRGLFGTAAGRRQIPLLVHRAAQGDFAPLVERFPTDSSMFAEGLYLSIACAEGTSRIEPADVAAYTTGTFLGSYRVDQQVRACSAWPQAEVPERLFVPVTTDHPTLVVSGEMDAATPPEASRELCSHLPNCQLLVIPAMGHVPFDLDSWTNGACLESLMIDFFELADPRAVDTSCLPGMVPPAFATGGG